MIQITKEAAQSVLDALKAVTDFAESNLCQHEETKLGGAIWEICCQCGAKWADDRGGKPPYEDPAQLMSAYEAVATLQAAIDAPEQGEPEHFAKLRSLGWQQQDCKVCGESWGAMEAPQAPELLRQIAEFGERQNQAEQAREPSDDELDAIFAKRHNVQDSPWVNYRRFARAVLAARSAP